MKEFTVNGVEYTISACTAVAIEAGDGEENRQDALYVTHMNPSGERFDEVVFGWPMDWLENTDAFMSMCEDAGAWTADAGTLRSVRLEDKETIRVYHVEENNNTLVGGPFMDEHYAKEVCELFSRNTRKSYRVVKRYMSFDKLKGMFTIKERGE